MPKSTAWQKATAIFYIHTYRIFIAVSWFSASLYYFVSPPDLNFFSGSKFSLVWFKACQNRAVQPVHCTRYSNVSAWLSNAVNKQTEFTFSLTAAKELKTITMLVKLFSKDHNKIYYYEKHNLPCSSSFKVHRIFDHLTSKASNLYHWLHKSLTYKSVTYRCSNLPTGLKLRLTAKPKTTLQRCQLQYPN